MNKKAIFYGQLDLTENNGCCDIATWTISSRDGVCGPLRDHERSRVVPKRASWAARSCRRLVDMLLKGTPDSKKYAVGGRQVK